MCMDIMISLKIIDFFKEGTRASYSLEMFKLDGDIIREYINTPGIGYEKVERILDALML